MAQPLTQTKSRSVLGATELTLMAPIKRGLIPALDSRSYQSRAKLVLDTLHALGVSRREIDPTPAIVEVADTIRAIRSFRLAIAGTEQRQLQPQVLLSVSFDGGWEPYIRRIWRPLGPLLDLIFCNCEGYLLSTQHGFPAYAGWVRQAQVETGFYYEDSPLTVADLQLLRPEKARALQPAPPASASAATLYEQARAALVAFYRLTDMYPDQPGNVDGEVLRSAARLLLGELSAVIKQDVPKDFLRTPTEDAAWRWFRKPELERLHAKPAGKVNWANVQAGILEPYLGLAHGRLLLVGLDDAAAVRAFIDHFKERWEVTPASSPFMAAGPLFINLAFTHAGLVLAGVDSGTLEQLPPEFREGMEARAGVLGDWEHNHPSHWTLPLRHDGREPKRVELSSVHAVVQFWLAGNDAGQLNEAVQAIEDALTGAGGRVLAVQPMQRITDAKTGTKGHFGFADGLSQPGLMAAGRLDRDTVAPGELLLGYSNDRDDNGLEGRLWTDSTFLVVRKLRQHVEVFNALNLNDEAKAKLMGRRTDGTNLIKDKKDNDFDFDEDPNGTKCPFFAHVRRANPRAVRRNELDHLPRIVRRGMSYGPLYNDKPDEERGLMFMAYNASIAEQFEVVQGWLAGRNSAGPGSFSGQRDPFLGVARAGDPRRFEWLDGKGGRQATDLPADRPLVTLQWGLYAFAPSLSALRELRIWANERALEDTVKDTEKPASGDDADAVQRKRDRRNREEARQAATGSALIARLQRVEQESGFDTAVEQWKIALEDPGARMQGKSQAIWTAVRKAHGGVLRTPYGVLVCSKTLVQQVFANGAGNYTVSGYNTRLDKCFGKIYLGRDDGDDYRKEADPANAAIMAVTLDDAFESSHRHTSELLDELLGKVRDHPAAEDDRTVEVRDLVDGLLARFCQEWFGLPDGTHVVAGGWHWREQATCPGHFHSPSRYTFQPQPGAQTKKVGEDHGVVLKAKVLEFVCAVRKDAKKQGRLGGNLFTQFPDDPGDDERLASNLIGVMMGFLPTVDGNLRGALFEWVRDRSLWDHQAALRSHAGDTALARALGVIRPRLAETMQLRPVPEVVWRTALRADTLGPLQVRAGDMLVVSIVSATQEDLLNERDDDPFVVFGGKRKPDPGDDKSKIPTHACPGYDMAIGMMLGFLAALMDTVSLRPAASPMALRIGPR